MLLRPPFTVHCSSAFPLASAITWARYLGFNKYLADEISLTGNEEACVAKARFRNVTQLELEFHLGLRRDLATWEKELVEDETFLKGNLFTLVPPASGPRINKIVLDHVVSPKWSPRQGMLSLQVGPGESWRGLVPVGGQFPVEYHNFTGGYNLVAERLA
jgi:hypothetical protein